MKLKIEHIAKWYGDHHVLDDVSLEISERNVSVLMGTNGSGKTTLFNIISGFIQQNKGSVLLNNEHIDKLKPYERKRKGIGRTFQDMRLVGNLTVKENVMLAFPEQRGEKWWRTLLPSRSVKEEQRSYSNIADSLIRTCFISEIAESKANEISYGQQKLLNLACCMASGASVLLLDEPAAGVNPVFREQLAIVVKELKAQSKVLLIIEHNVDFIESVADEILLLHDGKIQRYGSYQEFRDTPELLKAYI